MIIKTTIFVEIERIDNAQLPLCVDHLERTFTRSLQSKDWKTSLSKAIQEAIGIDDFKIITRKRAQEILRTSK